MNDTSGVPSEEAVRTADVRRRLETARRDLLDMTLRNPLLNFRQRSRGVIVQPLDCVATYARLVKGRKHCAFRASEPQLDGVARDSAKGDSAVLPVTVAPEELQKRLLQTFYNARTLIEEQGVNTLFLALGYLEWYEADSSPDPRRAPLVVVPVQLERSNARDHFVLKYSDDDVGDNLCLRRKLDEDFGIRLPRLLEDDSSDADELDIGAYFAGVREAIRGQSRWRVNDEMASLSFFSFAKFLMYHDLDPESWPTDAHIAEHPVLRALVVEGEEIPQPGEPLSIGAQIDDVVDPAQTHQVCDADSSQVRAIVAANRGLTMVIQGPPGTGKSQTITNIIAEAIGRGQTVLFVSEKMAALEVVKRRLDQLGLGDACLELHSRKTHKRQVLQEIGRTLQAAGYERSESSWHPDRVKQERDRLNAYERALHEPIGKTGVTPYFAMGSAIVLTAERSEGTLPAISLGKPWTWTAEDYRRRHALVEEAQMLVSARALPTDNPLWGIGLAESGPDVVRSARAVLKHALSSVKALGQASAIAAKSGSKPSTRLECEPLTHVGANIFALLSGKSRRARAALVAALEEHQSEIAKLIESLKLDEKAALGDSVPLVDLGFAVQIENIDRWLGNLNALDDLAAFNELGERLRAEGLTSVDRAASANEESATQLVAAFEYAWFSALLDRALSGRKALSGFVREIHEAAVVSFATHDVALLKANRVRLAMEHLKRLPSHDGAGGALAMLRKEIVKRRRQMPLRRLLSQTGKAVQAIKPVFMMSPLSIATFLEQGGTDFDLVIFDEASQVRPVDAFGAILRGKQTIVVGDEKQLPPTSFFDAMTSESGDEDDDGEEPLTAGIQSVLELFLAKDAPREPLLWHYRSRHHSLIALSNAEFYDNRLMVFPHAEHQRDDLGLEYHYLPDAVYGRGRSQRNPGEARAVAEAVLDHARENPGQTLGVAAFSTSQMQAILDELETMRRLEPEYEAFFAAHPAEPFFVKNLENVQGDERDVIFISVGYGRDAAGNVSMNFGPLNQQGGERRLNVLITRSRMRCEVFTNLTANDIDLTRTSARGVQALKHFLLYAETKVLDESLSGPPPTESPFEAAVRDVLEDADHQVDTQVGVASYRVDLAVVDEHDPGRYLLGIECDGAMYHHARSARDRDRLRQAVLEQMGWHLYRIWSTDWFKHPAREAQRLLAAVELAKAMPRDETEPARGPDLDADVAMPGEPLQAVRTTRAARRYEIAQLSVSAVWSGRLRDMSLSQLVEKVTEVVAIEGPVHFDLVARRLADAAQQSLGARASERIESACTAAQRSGRIEREGDFMWLPCLSVAPVRDRSKLNSAERIWDKVSDFELSSAIQQAALASFGLDPADVPRAVGQLLGFGRTSAVAETRVEGLVRSMIANGALVERGSSVCAPDGTTSLLDERVEKVTLPEEVPEISSTTSTQPSSTERVSSAGPVSPALPLHAAGERYLLAHPPVPRLAAQLWEAPAAQLAPVLIAVCKIESPIHVNELNHRIANAFGRKKVGGRTRESMAAARRLAAREGAVIVRGSFVWLPGQGPNVVMRDRSSLEAADKRIAIVALEEIAMAVLACLDSGLATTPEELSIAAARTLGFMRTGKDVADRIGVAVQAMLKAGVLVHAGAGFRQVGKPTFLGPRTPSPLGSGESSSHAGLEAGASPMAQLGLDVGAAAARDIPSAGGGNAPSRAADEVDEAIMQLRDKNIRRKAMDHLRHLGGKAVPALVAALHDPSVRLFVIVSLAEIGAPAVEPLEKLRRNRDPVIAEAAEQALDRMPKGTQK